MVTPCAGAKTDDGRVIFEVLIGEDDGTGVRVDEVAHLTGRRQAPSGDHVGQKDAVVEGQDDQLCLADDAVGLSDSGLDYVARLFCGQLRLRVDGETFVQPAKDRARHAVLIQLLHHLRSEDGHAVDDLRIPLMTSAWEIDVALGRA